MNPVRQKILHQDVGNGLTVIELTTIQEKKTHRYIIDTEDLRLFLESGPWYYKQEPKNRSGLSALVTREQTPVMQIIMNHSKEKDMIAYNINRNASDLRKVNYILIKNGKQHSTEFKALLEKKRKENRETDLTVTQILTSPIFGEKVYSKEKIQGQATLNPVNKKIEVWQNIGTQELVIHLGDKEKVSLNIKQARELAKTLQNLLN
ncbi:hypothetical protein JQN58_13795 [Aneurinibacillus sp. BA2021]|nr:hypothetical protein [Aneurinibacillus sp. BA2021]